MFLIYLFGTPTYSQNLDFYEIEVFDFESSLCYDMSYTQKIRTTSLMDLNTLTFVDKLNFKSKEYNLKHHDYLDANSNYINDVSFISHKNMFPLWYVHPYLIRTEKNGTKSYFSTENKYLDNGWEGGHYSKTDHGEYITDARNNNKYLNQTHSSIGVDLYTRVNNNINLYGVLYRYIWKYPKSSSILILENQGYNVISTSNMITATNSEMELVWDIVNKTFTQKVIENGIVVKTKHTIYSYVSSIQQTVKTKEIDMKPEVFENGDCYDLIQTTLYSDYSYNCNISQRSIDNEEKSEISLYPNPAHDKINIQLPCEECGPYKIMVSTITGEVVKLRSYQQFNGSLNISDIPVGIYILTVKTSTDEYLLKFVKN